MPSNEHRRKNAKKGYAVYRKVETRIRNALFALRGDSTTSVREISNKAGIWTSTFYRHYKNTSQARKSIEKEIVSDFNKELGNTKNDVEAFNSLILFVVRNKNFFLSVIKHEDCRIVLKIIEVTIPKINQNWPNFSLKDQKHIQTLMSGLFLEEIIYWGIEEKLALDHAKTCFNNLISINNNIPRILRNVTK